MKPLAFRVSCSVRSRLDGLMAPRQRFSGDALVLAPILAEEMLVPDFLGYAEQMNAAKAPAKILRLSKMWRQVRELHPSLTFSQKTMEAAFKAAAELAQDKWPRRMTPAEQSDWQASISRQFRTMARHIAQSTKCRWYAKLFEEAEESKGDGVSDAAGSHAAGPTAGDETQLEETENGDSDGNDAPVAPTGAQDGYFVAYDFEALNAYRTLVSNPTGKEWATNVEVVEGKPFPVAVFGDERFELTSLTAADLP